MFSTLVMREREAYCETPPSLSGLLPKVPRVKVLSTNQPSGANQLCRRVPNARVRVKRERFRDPGNNSHSGRTSPGIMTTVRCTPDRVSQ